MNSVKFKKKKLKLKFSQQHSFSLSHHIESSNFWIDNQYNLSRKPVPWKCLEIPEDWLLSCYIQVFFKNLKWQFNMIFMDETMNWSSQWAALELQINKFTWLIPRKSSLNCHLIQNNPILDFDNYCAATTVKSSSDILMILFT